MAHAESPALREKFYRAWVTRASDQASERGLGQQPADRGDPRAAPRGVAARRLQVVRRVLAGDEDGRVAAAASSSSYAISRSAAAPSRATSSRCCRSTRAAASSTPWDVAFYAERLKPGEAGARRGRAAAVLRAAARARRRCSSCPARCSTSRVTEARARRTSGTTACADYELKRADGTLVGSFYHRPVRAAEQARRRVDERLS